MFRIFHPTVGAGVPFLVGRNEATGWLMRR
jgi:hypothetical protein